MHQDGCTKQNSAWENNTHARVRHSGLIPDTLPWERSPQRDFSPKSSIHYANQNQQEYLDANWRKYSSRNSGCWQKGLVVYSLSLQLAIPDGKSWLGY